MVERIQNTNSQQADLRNQFSQTPTSQNTQVASQIQQVNQQNHNVQQPNQTQARTKIKKEEPSLSTQSLINPWLQAVCILKFDTEQGQILEHAYPPNHLHPSEEQNIARLAFPESNSLAMNEGNLLYTFRLRHFNKLPLNAISPQEHQFSFGFTLFNQHKDSKSSRGYTQRSIVIVSDLYFVQFYYQLVGIVASKCLTDSNGRAQYDDYGELMSPDKILKQFYDILSEWPIPIPGQTQELNVFGYLIQIDLPQDMLENLSIIQKTKRLEQFKAKGIHLNHEDSNDNNFIENQANIVHQQTSILTDESIEQESNDKEEFKEQQLQEQQLRKSNQTEDHEVDKQSTQKQDQDSSQNQSFHSSTKNQDYEQKHSSHQLNNSNKQQEQLETQNSNSRYRIETEVEEDSKQSSKIEEHDLKSFRSARLGAQNSHHSNQSNQQETELITYLTKQYSCMDMFGELIIQKYFHGQSILLLWQLWEIAITETPLLIVGDDPTECSHAVLILLSLISPLKTLADYRPYLTLYDQDIKDFSQQSKKKQIGNVILGVSNPFLITYLGQFPNILHFERGHFIEKKLQCPKDLDVNCKQVKQFSKMPKEVKHSLVTQNKLLLKPSKIALKHLNMDKSVEESLAINNWVLRRHFKMLTEDFLASFNPYLRVNYAVKGTGDLQQIQFNLTKPFQEKQFLSGIGKENTFCQNYMGGSRDKTVKLYKKFINTTLFRKYMNDKKKEIGARELFKFQQQHQNNPSQQQNQ
eukprot:403375913